MGRKNTKVYQSMKTFCLVSGIDEKYIYDRAKILLSHYREICWIVKNKADDTTQELRELCTDSIDTSMVYLKEFAPKKTKIEFKEQIFCLSETRELLALMDDALSQVRSYPIQGELFADILEKCYVGNRKYKDNEIMSIYHLERSGYYDRKKEAILVFAVTLWGKIIPTLAKEK